MNAALQDYRRIWRVTTVQRDGDSMALLAWVAILLGTAATLGAVLLVVTKHESIMLVPRMVLGFGGFWLAYAWAMLFVPGSVLLNSPANARLLPRQRRRLLQMAVGGWLSITIVLAAAIGEWSALPAAGLGLIGFVLMRAGKNVAVALFILASNTSSLSRFLPDALVDAAGSPLGLIASSFLMLPLGAWTLRVLYPPGGDGHLARRGIDIKRMLNAKRWDWTVPDESGRLRGWTQGRLYAAALRRDSARLTPGGALLHALGPAAHWSAWLGSIAVILLLAGGVRLLLAWRGEQALEGFFHGVMNMGLATLVIGVLFSTAAYSQQLRKTAGEQALLRLTPLAGSGALLNRRLAVELCKRALGHWTMLTALILFAAVLVGAGPDVLLREAALCVLAGQLAAMGLLGDFAGEGGWDVSLALVAGLAGLAELGAAFGLGLFSGVSVWVWLIAIALGVGAWQLRRAWRIMLAAAPAFPAGRRR